MENVRIFAETGLSLSDLPSIFLYGLVLTRKLRDVYSQKSEVLCRFLFLHGVIRQSASKTEGRVELKLDLL